MFNDKVRQQGWSWCVHLNLLNLQLIIGSFCRLAAYFPVGKGILYSLSFFSEVGQRKKALN